MDKYRPKCKCGNLCKKNGISKKDGRQLYYSYCRSCSKTKEGSSDFRLKNLKNDYCESCGFLPKHPCQLDVDHINGDRANNSKSNLKTLCANCHRLKTYINNDWREKMDKGISNKNADTPPQFELFSH